ncbi:MAG: hypothetical protein JO013_07780 [Alphaproteobacteria bacterium]|nr:hypothetical protein [Alphaproteobacteria bacterium]
MRPVSRAAPAAAALLALIAAAPPPPPAAAPGDVLCVHVMTETLALAKTRPGVPADAVSRMESAVAFFVGAANARLDDDALMRGFREAATTFAAADRLQLFQACDARFTAGLRRAQDMVHRSVGGAEGGAPKP